MNKIKINGMDYTLNTDTANIGTDKKNEYEKIVVHNGKFHADDVFCVAMAHLCYPDIEVYRVNAVPDELNDNENVIVADIGFGKYDHHQLDAECRENGDKYAACGLLFRDLKNIIFDNNVEAAKSFEIRFIIPVEICDNGGRRNPLSDAISAFNPGWDSMQDIDEAFACAVAFVEGIIAREVNSAKSEEGARNIVEEAFRKSDGTVVILPKYVPWQNVLIPSTAEFVVFPSNRGGYSLQTVRRDIDTKESKNLLPAEWLDHRPDGCTFVHPGLFIAAFDSEESAMTAAYSRT